MAVNITTSAQLEAGPRLETGHYGSSEVAGVAVCIRILFDWRDETYAEFTTGSSRRGRDLPLGCGSSFGGKCHFEICREPG